MEDVTFDSVAPTAVPPPSALSNPPMIYSSPPIVQQQPQLETRAPQAQPVNIDVFNRFYGVPPTDGGAANDLTHQEAIYNAGIWADLMKNFGFNQ